MSQEKSEAPTTSSAPSTFKPTGAATQDQIAAVMLMTGNKGQVAEAVAHFRGIELSTSPQRRYWLFAGNAYYPSGGMKDFIGSSDDLAACRLERDHEAIEDGDWNTFSIPEDSDQYNWYHILDTLTGRVVEGYDHGYPTEDDNFDVLHGKAPPWPTK